LISGKLVLSQDFYKEYELYRFNKATNHSIATQKSIQRSVKNIRLTFKEFKLKQGHSFLSGNTFYIVYFLDLKYHPVVIWNNKESCGYKYVDTIIRFNRKININVNASNIIKRFPEQFKKWIVTGDSINFSEHAKELKILNSEALSFTKVVKKGNKWKFTSASSYTIDL